ncbi:HlyD family efflux transporter periplasmic adaptor subunit [Flavonifractor plautii]|uniref:HlyD family efflux transporter periplasmic adaptor subunit n=1 Tax=Flavonifractor plautii TaxID=292800 RepID=A0A6I2RG47_FLAPL|nr:HlyD family efflux transporter periplasmic adaptor subunit [Flavonifractor plautii]MDB7925287.1 HlyD family efflux transporter periplasmic adaptor subunit [Flavonifractor plautii]MSB02841.1 HlyD family efflux transporter periplasmic adaptor subunit [Flavonifractor plautii]MSB07971.1 HlyD family efflux transporter periplasmic adaptor subunit [Flavonifractor plautii]MSB48043.1 HlyD family efflux transporter periplasmic adaptor subunit [Flavonifractor plautii]UBS61106.1 HlyD family efflux tran
MTEQQTPVMTPPAAPPAAPTGPKKKRKGRGKTIAGILIVAAIAIALVVLVWYFVFREDGSKGEVMTDFVTRGSIQSMVEGSGTTKAKDSATVTPGSGTILELFVQEGDQVTAGQQLYRMDDTTARDAVTEAQKSVDNCNKELQAVYDKIAELSITAPHAGNLREVADLKVGDTVNEGDTIATLVNDTKLRLSLYYSYAYEGDIKVGQTAQISIPAIMAPVTGKVEQINKVRFVSPEGATHFEVVLVLDNPGTLAEGMDASAGLTAADGTPIYPYQNGKLEYYESTKITAKATGPVERVSLLNYGDVKAGQLLVQLGAKDTDEEIASKENALKAAQEKLEEATKELEKYNAVAPIDGTVLQCSLTEGQEVSSGQGITIADTSQMIIEIQVDERNARYIKAGMMVDINQYGTPYVGIVESVSMTASGENGVASIPAVVTVDNYDGSMIPGTYAEYSFVASESEDCLTVPVQAVKYVSFANVQLPETLDADPSAGMDDGMMDDGMMDDGMMDDGMMDDGMMDGGMVDGGVEALPQSYSGGAFADPLGMIAVPMPGGGVVVDGGSMGGSSGGASDDSTGVIVWVKSKEAPANAILEPDPTWDCPESFWAVPVEVGLSDNSKVEITRGLAEGQEVFIGYQNPDEMYY